MAPALLALPFTGGASVPLTMGRVALMSGGQGLVASYGAQDETIEPIEVAVETGISTVAGPVFAKLTQAIGGIAKKGFENRTYLALSTRISRRAVDELSAHKDVELDDLIQKIDLVVSDVLHNVVVL